MSNLSSKTEQKAIEELAQCLKHFDNLANLKMTAFDAEAARVAENVIKGIIETNGYRISYFNHITGVKKE
jgi:ribulose bisphosphate carboxylase small subunit